MVQGRCQCLRQEGDSVRIGSGVLESYAVRVSAWHPIPHRISCQEKICNFYARFKVSVAWYPRTVSKLQPPWEAINLPSRASP
jgi:hypothetical protein